MLPTLIQKLRETKDNPGLYRALTPEEQAELFLALFAPKPKLFEKPKVIKGIDGVTPVKDKDYIGKETAELFIADLAEKTHAELEAIIQAKLATLKSGKDAVITPGLVSQIADMVHGMIKMPDFPTLLTMEPEAIRDGLELLPDGEKLAQSAVEGLEQELKELKERPVQVVTGGISRNTVQKMIDASATGDADWTYYATTWSTEPTLNDSITGGDVYNYTLDGTTRYRFVPSTYDATEDAFYETFSGGVLSDLIVTRG